MTDQTRRFLERLPDTIDEMLNTGWYTDPDGEERFSPILLDQFAFDIRQEVAEVLEVEDEVHNLQESDRGKGSP